MMAAYVNPVPSVDNIESKNESELEFEVSDYTPKRSVYFAFIDVLGFKKAFDDNRLIQDDNCADKFENVFTYYFELMNSANFNTMREPPLFYAGQTSDSLYFYTESTSILIEYLKIFSHFNVYAMTQDVFFRGGVANGNIFFNEGYQFYGDSVIKAYLLESEVSKNPVITIDENTYKAMSNNNNSLCDKLIISHNGRYYLRPFAYLENNFYLDIDKSKIEIRGIDQECLEKIIEENKSKFEYDPKNYEKYVFLLNEYKEKNRIK